MRLLVFQNDPTSHLVAGSLILLLCSFAFFFLFFFTAALIEAVPPPLMRPDYDSPIS